MKHSTNKQTQLGNHNANINHNSRLSERIFIARVQRLAMFTINNVFAGCTTNELHFIHDYYISHQRQRLNDAIVQCAFNMLEQHRQNELPMR